METQEKAKTTIFNLIVLDESGSMSSLVEQTVSGCNEIIKMIQHAQMEFGETQRNLISIYAFQSHSSVPSRYIIKNEKPEDVSPITNKEYTPCGGTPLYDAIGATLSDLRTVAATHEDATAIVHIITDGYENSSRSYGPQQVAMLIDACKEMGWTINFIGANVDVHRMQQVLHIDNGLSYLATEQGTEAMMEEVRSNHNRVIAFENENADCSQEERMIKRKKNARNFFKHSDSFDSF